MANPTSDRVSYLNAREPSIDRRFRQCPTKKQQLQFNGIEEEDDLDEFRQLRNNSDAESTGSSGNSSTNNKTTASVYLRLGPVNPKQKSSQYEIENKYTIKTRTTGGGGGGGAAANSAEKHYTFTTVLDSKTTQAQMYTLCAQNPIENGENFTVLTYGTSGSGKTYTLLGDSGLNLPGIVPRAIEHLFTKYNEYLYDEPAIKIERGNIIILDTNNILMEKQLRKELFGNKQNLDTIVNRFANQRESIQNEHTFSQLSLIKNENKVFFWISCAEIYNENVYDLLTPTFMSGGGGGGGGGNGGGGGTSNKRPNLKIISNDGNAFVNDLTKVYVKNCAETLHLLALCQSRVSIGATNVNSNSSRSHSILFLDIIHINEENQFNHMVYKFCDLAGSERLKKTDNIGNRLREAQNINCSLMVLGRCLDAVYHKNSIVPFRESKLTILLQAALLGKEKLSMIVNMKPIDEFYEENLNVLNFASMAKQIVYKPVQIIKVDESKRRFSWFITKMPKEETSFVGETTQISLLFDENEELKDEIKYLKEENNRQREEIVRLNEELEEQAVEITNRLIDDKTKKLQIKEELWTKRYKHQAECLNRELQQKADQNNKLKDKIKKLETQMEKLENQLAVNVDDIESPECQEPPRKQSRTSV